MSILTKIRASTNEDPVMPGPADDWWYDNFIGSLSSSGIRLSPETAFRSAAVYGGVKVLAESLSSLPLHLYSRRPNAQGKDREPDHPLYDILRWEPNTQQTALEFWRLMIAVSILWGSAHAYIQPGRRGFADQLVPLPPNLTTPRIINGERVIETELPDMPQQKVYLLPDEVFTISSLSLDVVTGLGIPEVARDAIGLAVAMEQYGAAFFRQGTQVGGVLSVEGELSEAAQKRMAKSWQQAHSGLASAHSVAVLEEGAKYSPTAVTGRDAQLVEQLKFQIEQVARFLRIPPHKIGIMEHATFGNIEEQGLEFITDSLGPIAVNIEQRIRKQLIIAKDRFFAEFLFDSLMRGRAIDRAGIYQIYLQNRVMTPNEVRLKENMNPIDREDMNEPLTPVNLGFFEGGGQEGEEDDDDAQAALGVSASTNQPTPQLISPVVQGVVEQSAKRLVVREVVALRNAAKRTASDLSAFRQEATDFYHQHAGLLVENLLMSEDAAEAWCVGQLQSILNFGPSIMESWETEKPAALAAAVLEQAR